MVPFEAWNRNTLWSLPSRVLWEQVALAILRSYQQGQE